MAKNKQVNLKLDDSDVAVLKQITDFEGRSEQDVLRDSLRIYACNALRHKELLESVEKGWLELRSGLGEVVGDDDDFFATVKKELRNEKTH